MKKLFKIFIFLFIATCLSPTKDIRAYSNFIAFGYSSCITCHYNALGNGPLNDYGRSVSATGIAARALYSDKKSEEELSDESSFFLGKFKDNKWLRPSLNIRGLRYDKNIFLSSRTASHIPMQAEANLVLRPLSNDKFFLVGTYGYAPTPQSSRNTNKKVSNVISREHYLQYTIAKGHRLYLGFMDKAYGLRIPDHTAYSRMNTTNGQNDQSHGVIYHYTQKNYELAFNAFMGNMYQDAPLRQQGFAINAEYEIVDDFRLGLTSLYSKNKYVNYFINGLTARSGFDNGASIIAEFGAISTKPLLTTNPSTLGVYSMTQAMLKLTRGVHFLTSYEYFKSDISSGNLNSNYRYIMGLQVIPAQRIELRFDLVNSRIVSSSTVYPDSWNFMSQVHLWF